MTSATSLAERPGGVLASSIVPNRPVTFERSFDLPSTGDIRPFGLSLSTVTDATPVNTTGITYDANRQISIGADGMPIEHSPLMGTTPFTSYWDTENDGHSDPDSGTDS